MQYPRVIPHSDGAGYVDLAGEGVTAEWISRRVWCYGAQSYRAFGTAAEHAVVPASQVAPLPDGVSFEQGACLGIPAITAHRCVHTAGPVEGRTVLVQRGAGAVTTTCGPGLREFIARELCASVRRPTARLAGCRVLR